MEFKKRDYKNYIICVKMFTRPTMDTLEILPKEEYNPRRYRFFGDADTYADALELLVNAYEKFLEMKSEKEK